MTKEIKYPLNPFNTKEGNKERMEEQKRHEIY